MANDTIPAQAAQAYKAKGYAPIPAPPGEKNPNRKGWQSERHTPQDIPRVFAGNVNIGLLCGEPSGGLYDVDCDTPEAAKAAPSFLPATGMRHGRPGKPHSHYWYRCPNADVKTKQFDNPISAVDAQGKKTAPKLLELRGTGGQTIVPPSLHPSGERYVWENDGEPATAAYDDLRRAVSKVAACALLARAWPGEGNRDHAAMALCGALLRAGWAAQEVGRFVTTVARVAGDEEWERRDKAAASLRAQEEGRETTGWPRLAELLTHGEMVVKRVREWLGIREAPSFERAPLGETPGEDAPHCSDLGNAQRFQRLYGTQFRYCAAWKCWLVYDGRRWKQDDTGAVMRAAQETVKAIYREAGNADDRAAREALSRWALSSESDKRLKAMLSQAQALLPITPAQLDADGWALNCLNGTLDLRTGELRQHSPDDYLTRLAPVAYRAGARFAVWERFLADMTCQDSDLAAYLQRALGYSITGCSSEKVLFLGYGGKDSGKTTLLEAVKATLGDYASTADFAAFTSRHGQQRDAQAANPALADLKGRRFVGSSEVEDGAPLAVALVKWVTGGDTITARFLNANPFSFKPSHKLWLIANHAPKVPIDDDAVWGRIKRIPFNLDLKKLGKAADPTIKQQLSAPEIAGEAILAWLVQGCLAWQREGLGTCTAVEDSTEAYRKDNDPLSEFIEDRCVEAPQAQVTSAALWEAYEGWCRETRIRGQLTRKRFADLLKAHGYKQVRVGHKQVRGWAGIGLLATGDEPDPERNADTCRRDADASGDAASPDARRCEAGADASRGNFQSKMLAESLRENLCKNTSACVCVSASVDEGEVNVVRQIDDLAVDDEPEAVMSQPRMKAITPDTLNQAASSTNGHAHSAPRAPLADLPDACLVCGAEVTHYSPAGHPYCARHLPDKPATELPKTRYWNAVSVGLNKKRPPQKGAH